MLSDPILLITTASGESAATLPEVLAHLCDATLIGFEGLAAHQTQAWEQFLCQIAALALLRSGESGAVDDDAAWAALSDAPAWAARLAALTPGCAETAWSLVVDDPTCPAFLQPPILSGRLADYGMAGRTPDEIDLPITAKGHDLKPARAVHAAPRHWLFALVALQTQQGYSGRGNFGIARMNGGFGSRPLVMTLPAKDWPARFRRGVEAALTARRAALNIQNGHYQADGKALLWLAPWDDEESENLAGLDPLFVEICRRIRLVRPEGGGIVARGRPSEVARVAVPEMAKGNLGDAWTPILKGTALTVGPGGFDYRLLTRLLQPGEAVMPPAVTLKLRSAGEAWLRATVLVRGQGKTEGLHERWLRIPAGRSGGLSRSGEARRWGELAQSMAKEAGEASDALRHALLVFLQGGADKIDFDDKRPREWQERFHAATDGIFFKHLFDRLAADTEGREEPCRAAWHSALQRIVRELFNEATARLSPPEQRREKGLALASIRLGALLRKAGLSAPQPQKETSP